MNTPSPFALQIDQVADQFEAAWKAGGRPEPGDFLTKVPDAARAGLLVELVRVEVEYRRKGGEAITEQESLQAYRERYAHLPGVSAGLVGPATPIPTSPDPAEPPAAGSANIEQYQFQRELGVGGMGVVWLARDTRLERDVAIKVLKAGLAGHSSQRLLREARSAAQLSHPNVVSIFHVLERDGQICIVMELLGRSLADELGATGPLPWPQATQAVRDAADGLAAAHAAGLVHRDIKPSNLLRTARGDVKVADFGLVDSTDATQLTATGVLLGTPGYMAPEQCRGEEADARSDVYSLGCTFYHLLTGRPPFEADSPHGVLAKHAKDPFPDARQIVADLPDAVCHVIATATRKDPRLRYPTAAQMLAELKAILAPPTEEVPPVVPVGGRLRIFISSPGDVAEERVLANNLVRRLSDEYADRLWIEPVFWEHEPLVATSTFQKQIPPPRDCEIAICILWSRIGTRLQADITRQKDTRFGPAGSRYASGTEYEFEDAALGFDENGKPELLVYRKTADPVVSLQDEAALLRKLEQKKALDAFIQKWFFNPDDTLKAAFHTFATTTEFEQVLEEHLRKLIARRLPKGDRSTTPAKPSWTSGSPFRGLDVFDFQHAPVFFGRTQAIGDVLNALRTNAAAGRGFVLVVGVSGGGKSSLVRAGVLPVLTQPGVIEGVGLWRRAILKPSDASTLLRSLAASLLQPDALPELGADGTTADQLADSLQQNPAAAFPLIKGGLSQAAAAMAKEQDLPQQPEARLVIVADQLEELFTLRTAAPAERQAFIAALSSLARSGKVSVIGTLRGDFYHRAFELPELVALQEGSGQYALPLPTSAEIGQVIRQPARAAGLSFEEDPQTKVSLDEVLREAASVSPESLPLLEFALEELYQRKTPTGLLTYAAYKELGGVEGALTQRAEAIFESLQPDVQVTLPRVMRALVNVGDGDSIARQQSSLDAVAPTAEAKAFVEAFVQARLFSADRTEQGVAVVRVTHEALLRNWPRVVQSLENDKALLIVRARVSAAAARWMADGKPADLLLGEGKPLAEAENLAAAWGDELTPADRALIAASKTRRTGRRVVLAAVLVVMIIAGLLIRSKVAEQKKATQADGFVKKLIAADTAEVPDAVKEIAAYRQWADPLLRHENEKAAPDSREKLRTSLGLLPVDASQVDYVYGRLLTAEPNEVPVIRDALFSHRQALLDRLWAVVEKPEKGKESARLRAAAALAIYDPDARQWAAAGPLVVDDLVRENPMFFGRWSESFRPVRHQLLAGLAAVFRDRAPEDVTKRSLATNLLVDYAADQTGLLAELLMDGDEEQFAAIYPKAALRAPAILPLLTAEVERRLAKDEERDGLAKRQANAGVALLRLNQPANVWPMLKHSPDPSARSYLIDRLAPLGADPLAIVRRLDEETDISIRRALILSLGEFSDQDLSKAGRSSVLPKIQDIYRTAEDPGLHAAAEWLLRQWEQEPWLAETNAAWAKENRVEQVVAALKASPNPAPRWYVNSQEQTMIAIPGPVEVEMPLPTDHNCEHFLSQKVRIVRTFALAAKPVTVEQFLPLYKKYKYKSEEITTRQGFDRLPGMPMSDLRWFEAAGYCNWLSKVEGIPEDQWCYDVDPGLGRVSKLKANYLSLTGYRLPSRAEYEYAARAGAVTSRYYGDTDELLSKYAWYSGNSQNLGWPVGGKKPNDLGFFDLLGTVYEWCNERFIVHYRMSAGGTLEDKEDEVLDFILIDARVLYGNSSAAIAGYVALGNWNYDVPVVDISSFRVVRTLYTPAHDGVPGLHPR